MVRFLPFSIHTFRCRTQIPPTQRHFLPPIPSMRFVCPTVCPLSGMRGSTNSHFSTQTSLLQACVQNCFLLAIWQLTSATAFQHGPPPFSEAFTKRPAPVLDYVHSVFHMVEQLLQHRSSPALLRLIAIFLRAHRPVSFYVPNAKFNKH